MEEFRRYLPDAFYGPNGVPETYRNNVELKARDGYEKLQGYKIAKIIKGSGSVKEIALTFDDGPHLNWTLHLLQLLKSLNVQATFFVVGKQVVRFPTLVQLEVIQGHEIGNHTYDHVNMTKIPRALIGYELDQCDRAIGNATGGHVRFFRPPGGDYDGDVVRAAAARGYITTLWTDDPGDYRRIQAEVIEQRLLARLSPGGIILLHDGIPQTMQMLPSFVAECRRRGYKFVTMSKLAQDCHCGANEIALRNAAGIKTHPDAPVPVRPPASMP